MAVSALFEFPPAVASLRPRFFAVEDDFVLTADDFRTYWPYVDNIWSSVGAPASLKAGRTAYYRCRLHATKDWVPEGEGKKVRRRMKPSRTAIGCGMRMRVVTNGDCVTVSRTGVCTEHVHTLEDSDRWKRPSHFRELAAAQVASGYKVADVARNLRGVDRPAD